MVRINVDAPRIGVKKDPALLAEVFTRLEALVQDVLDGELTYQGLLGDIGEASHGGLPEPHDAVPPREGAKVIVLKEDQPGEHRVALTPRASADLAASGMRVWVEAGAGSRAGYRDKAYIKAGATITAERSELFQDADAIAWVKPPAELDLVLSQLPPGCTIVGFTHPLHDDTIAHEAHRREPSCPVPGAPGAGSDRARTGRAGRHEPLRRQDRAGGSSRSPGPPGISRSAEHPGHRCWARWDASSAAGQLPRAQRRYRIHWAAILPGGGTTARSGLLRH